MPRKKINKKRFNETRKQKENRIRKENKRIIKVHKKNKKNKKIQPVIYLSKLDIRRIQRLLFYGIQLRIKIKKIHKYKIWIRGFTHIFTTASSACSAYRKMFKILKGMGVYIP